MTVFGSLILTATDSFPIVFLGLVSIEHILSTQCLTLIPITAFVKNASLRFVLVGGNLVKHPRSLMSDIFQEKGVHTVLGMLGEENTHWVFWMLYQLANNHLQSVI